MSVVVLDLQPTHCETEAAGVIWFEYATEIDCICCVDQVSKVLDTDLLFSLSCHSTVQLHHWTHWVFHKETTVCILSHAVCHVTWCRPWTTFIITSCWAYHLGTACLSVTSRGWMWSCVEIWLTISCPQFTAAEPTCFLDGQLWQRSDRTCTFLLFHVFLLLSVYLLLMS